MEWPLYQPLGDRAVLISYEDRIDPAINRKVQLYSEAIEKQGFPWLQDVLFSYRCLVVIYDPHRIQFAEVVTAVRHLEKTLSHDDVVPSRFYEIPTAYGGLYGPDLGRVAQVTHRTTEDVIRIFSSTVFVIYFLGFLCAQPYLGGLPEDLQTPRLDTPRVHVPAGSVGIGGVQAGVITIDQPSGYNYIGRTFLSLYDPAALPPTCLKAGDRVMFSRISEDQIPAFRGKLPLLSSEERTEGR